MDKWTKTQKILYWIFMTLMLSAGAVAFVVLEIYIVGGIFGLLALGSGYMVIKGGSKEEKEKEKKEKDPRTRTHSQAEEFYSFCMKNGISEMTKSNIARLELMIDQGKVKADKNKIEELFNKGKAELQARNKEVILVKLEEEEKQLEEDAGRFAEYVGREKPIKICRWKAENCQLVVDKYDAEYAKFMEKANNYYRGSKERESSWAIHGGIASGIAGGAAGVAVAADVERRNAEKRARNQQLARGVAELTINSTSEILRLKRNAEAERDAWTKKAFNYQACLVEGISEKDLMEKLSPKAGAVKISPTGALKFTVETEAVNLTIYDDVKAVVDGTIKAIVLKDNKQVGEVFVTLPLNGTSTKNKIETICRKPNVSFNKETDIKVIFEPYHLWAIEQK